MLLDLGLNASFVKPASLCLSVGTELGPTMRWSWNMGAGNLCQCLWTWVVFIKFCVVGGPAAHLGIFSSIPGLSLLDSSPLHYDNEKKKISPDITQCPPGAYLWCMLCFGSISRFENWKVNHQLASSYAFLYSIKHLSFLNDFYYEIFWQLFLYYI